jgi:PAS domain S-box-containing protein
MSDVTKRKIAEQLLIKNEKNYRSLIESSSDGIAIHNGEKFLYVNQTFFKIFGCSKASEFKKIHPAELIQRPEYVKINKERLRKVKNGIKVPFMKFPLKSPFNGKIIKLETKPILFNDNGEKVFQIILRDMSAERKLIKEQIRVKLAKESNLKLKKEINSRQKAEKKLKESLKEKEILFKEVHHRVKNNMQVISSILNLQSHSIKDPKIRRLFEESHDRIKSMALVHENLYKTKNLNRIDFDDYIKTLISNLFRTYGVNDNISLEIKKSNVYLSLDVGIPCGLIINELISNSVKHAFKNKNKNSIFVKLIKLPDNKLQLTVKDNGIGIDNSIDIYNTESMGLQLVTTLIEQINGKIELDNKKGTKFVITFND